MVDNKEPTYYITRIICIILYPIILKVCTLLRNLVKGHAGDKSWESLLTLTVTAF